MYQQQLTNLLHTFNQSTGHRYRISRLFNDLDYRNRVLAKEFQAGSNKVRLLIKQIQMYEDLLGHELQVDCVAKPTSEKIRVFNLVLFAVCSFLFVGGSVYTFEEIKDERKSHNTEQD